MGTTGQLSWSPLRFPEGVPTQAAKTREIKVAFPIIALPLGFDVFRPDLNQKLRRVEREAGVKHPSGIWILAGLVTSNLFEQLPSVFLVAAGANVLTLHLLLPQ